MTIVFKNPRPKIRKEGVFSLKYQIRHFWSEIQVFLFVCEILPVRKFQDVNLKDKVIVLKSHPKSAQINHIWSQI